MNRRTAAVLAAIGGTFATAIMLAPSAQAANLGTIVWNGTTLTPSSLNAQPLDTFLFNNTSNDDVKLIGNLEDSFSRPCNGSIGRCEVMSIFTSTFTVIGVGQVQVEDVLTSTVATSFYTNGSGGSSSSSTASSSSPAPIVQQFGKPSSGTCDAAAPTTLNWGGAPSGGWGESWAQWMNGGSGGSVCTRTLVYSNTLNAWTVS